MIANQHLTNAHVHARQACMLADANHARLVREARAARRGQPGGPAWYAQLSAPVVKVRTACGRLAAQVRAGATASATPQIPVTDRRAVPASAG